MELSEMQNPHTCSSATHMRYTVLQYFDIQADVPIFGTAATPAGTGAQSPGGQDTPVGLIASTPPPLPDLPSMDRCVCFGSF